MISVDSPIEKENDEKASGGKSVYLTSASSADAAPVIKLSIETSDIHKIKIFAISYMKELLIIYNRVKHKEAKRFTEKFNKY